MAGADRIAKFKEVVEMMPDDPLVRFDLAGVYLDAGQAEAAAAEYAETVRLKPDYSAAYRGLGRIGLSASQIVCALIRDDVITRQDPVGQVVGHGGQAERIDTAFALDLWVGKRAVRQQHWANQCQEYKCIARPWLARPRRWDGSGAGEQRAITAAIP